LAPALHPVVGRDSAAYRQTGSWSRRSNTHITGAFYNKEDLAFFVELHNGRSFIVIARIHKQRGKCWILPRIVNLHTSTRVGGANPHFAIGQNPHVRHRRIPTKVETAIGRGRRVEGVETHDRVAFVGATLKVELRLAVGKTSHA
jgi:hypothetical protein